MGWQLNGDCECRCVCTSIHINQKMCTYEKVRVYMYIYIHIHIHINTSRLEGIFPDSLRTSILDQFLSKLCFGVNHVDDPPQCEMKAWHPS